MAALKKLLPILNLATLGGDPIDNPTPWSWATWMERFSTDRAPWARPRWVSKTRFTKQEWKLVRDFLDTFYDAADDHKARCAFATSLSKGPLFAGRQLLANRFVRDWDAAGVDTMVEAILESMNICTLDDPHVHMLGDVDVKSNIAQLLFGEDAFDGHALEPLVAKWIDDLLGTTAERWIYIYNERWLITERVQREVVGVCRDIAMYTCGAHDLIRYLRVLSSLVQQLNLTVDNERQMLLDQYCNLLHAIDMLVDGGEAPGICMPPNMRNALMDLPSPQHRAGVKEAVVECWTTLDVAADNVPSSFSLLFDLYDRLLTGSIGAITCFDTNHAHLEEYPEEQGVDSPLWDQEHVAGYLFAALTLPHKCVREDDIV